MFTDELNLQNHRVPCTLFCPLCDNCTEDEWHVMFDCSRTKQSWRITALLSVIEPWLQKYSNIQDVIFDTCCVEDWVTVGKIAILMDALWKFRNGMVWNGEKTEVEQIDMRVTQGLNVWISAQQQQPVMDNNNIEAKWFSPLQNRLKCNVDAV
ncbi:unnamed protein product [Vicia faba]|uniref:Reverse transcriptase zinc-binding domain-containing protein n=1 Tax=Vicia faba TaxID=3906 RepID=A0AAV1AXD5_VICFA|nr:unnamed protein product [Vicia faba]